MKLVEMIYDKYKARIEYLAKLWAAIKRFKFLIMSAILAVTAIISGLVAAKGAISWKTEPISEISYGESLSMEANAFLSDVSYEYKAEDGQVWKSGAPTSAGKYSVRAVADAAFGKKRYTDPKTFTILPVGLTLTLDEVSITYGEMPTLACDGLVGGDQISCVGVVYDGLNTATESIASVTPQVINEKGVDVTGCYTFAFESAVIDITPRNITIDTPTATKVYDGTPLTATEYAVSTESGLGLYEGDKITSSITTELINAGEIKNEMTLGVENADGVDVSAYYAPTYNTGTLTVTKRPITVESQGHTWTYDGTEHTYAFSLPIQVGEDSGLVQGHAIQFNFTGAITNAGTAENTFTVEIADGNGSVTSNYDINPVYGVLTVDKRPITITSESYDGWTYNAENRQHTHYAITSGTLADGQSESVSFTGTIKNVGSVENTFTAEICDGTTPVTSNYEITPIYGTLTVNKADLVLLTNNDSRAYDGTPLYNTDYTVTSGELFGGQTLTFTDKTEITFVGTTDNVLTTYTIEQNGNAYDGDFLLNDNYNVTIDYGTLEITKCSVIVTAASDEKTYDGAPFIKAEFTTENLPENHTLTATVTTQNAQKHVGAYTNVASGASVSSTAHGDVTNQFDFTYVDGTLTINKRQVKLILSDVEKMYDGGEQTVKEEDLKPAWDSAYYEPVDGDDVVYAIDCGDLTNVGTTITYYVSVTFIDDNHGNNYDVIDDPASAEFSITPIPILIKVHSHTFTYDGNAHGCFNAGCTYTDSDFVFDEEHFGLANAHTVSILDSAMRTDAGSEPNTVSLKVNDGNDGKNYDISYQVGNMLTIDKRTIQVKMHSHTWTYDAQEHGCTDTYCGYDSSDLIISDDPSNRLYDLVVGHELSVISSKKITNAGSVKNEIALKVINDGNNGDNYDISYADEENGSMLIVDKRTIKVQAHTFEVTYNGELQGCKENNCPYTENDLIDGTTLASSAHTLELVSARAERNVGTYDNVIEVRVNDGNDGNNYHVEYESNTFTITARKVSLQLNDITKIYNGESQTVTLDDVKNNSAWLNDETFVLPVDEAIFTLNCPVLTNVETDDFTLFITFNDGNNGNNYAIAQNPVTAQFTVAPRPVVIKTHSHTWTYDGEAHGCETKGCVYTNLDLSELSEYNLLDGHTLKITFAPTVVNVWDTESENNQITFNVNGDGNDGNNYVVTCEYGTLTITPRDLVIQSHDHTWEYDGVEHNCNNETEHVEEKSYTYTGLVNDQQYIKVAFTASIVNFGETSNTFAFDVYSDASQTERITDNYALVENEETYGTLRITKREITLTTHTHDDWTYDGTTQSCLTNGCSYTHAKLLGGHTLQMENATGITNVSENGKTNEVTFWVDDGHGGINYNVTVSAYGTLSLAKRAVYFNLGTVQKTYNGEKQYPVEEDISYTLSEDTGYYPLVGGHVVRFFDITCDGGKEVGSVGFTFRVVIANGNDEVTANYDIQPDNLVGVFEILPKPIIVRADSITRVYNGTDQTPTVEELNLRYDENALVRGHAIVISTAGLETRRNAGEYDIAVGVQIFEDTNYHNDVTGNYVINGNNTVIVKFIIEKRQITIQSHDYEWMYDGTEHNCNGETNAYTVVDPTETTGLVSNHSLTLNFTGKITNVVERGVQNTFTFTVYDENSALATDNYVLVENEDTYGTLTVTPRTVRVEKTHTHTFTYNGWAQSCITCGDGYAVTVDEEKGYYSILSGHELTILTATEVTTVAECGASGIENAVTFSVNDGYGGANYTFITEGVTNGLLTMNKAAAIVVTKTCDHRWEYDGQAHGCAIDGTDCNVEADGVMAFDRLVAVEATSIIEVGTRPNEVKKYQVKSTFSGLDVTENYEGIVIADDVRWGTLEITQNVLRVEAISATETYSGQYPFADYEGEYLITYGSLKDGYTLTVECAVDNYIVNAGETTAHRLKSVTVWYNGNDVTGNFDIETKDGTFTIAQRWITIAAKSETHVYTGEEFTIATGAYERPVENLLDGHRLTVETLGASGINVDDYVHEIIDGSAVIVDKNGVEVTDNYYVDGYINGLLSITPRPIIITTGSAEKVYDSMPLTKNEYGSRAPENAEGGLAVGHEIANMDVTGSQTVVGTSYNTFDDNYDIVDESGNSVKINYEITKMEGTLTVTPRPLTIWTGSAEKVYDGTPLTCDEWGYDAPENGGLVVGHDVESMMTITGSQTDADTSYNTFEYDIVDENGESVKSNYAVTVETGELTVLKRTLKFKTGSATKPYDGTPLTNAEYTYISGLMHEHKLDTEKTYTIGTITEIGQTDNMLVFGVLDKDDHDITHNYEFSDDCDWGVLVVTDPNPTVLFYVTTDRDGHVYLRSVSYGDYDASTGEWGIPNLYVDSPVSPLYYAGLAVAEYDVTASTVTIEAAEGYEGILPYMLPYYVTGSDGEAYGDVYAEYDWTDSYTIDYYAYFGRTAVVPAEYAQAEAAYREYVYDNYVALPQTTKAYMQSIIDIQGWNADDEDIIDVVAAYIRNAAKYNKDYDVSLESAGDIAVAFLRDYKEGVCRHYASAATAMFRTLGIPARYTTGYHVLANQGERMEVTEGHAWVEVYIDGMGWVNVEVTGSGDYKETMKIKPEDFIGSSAVYSYYNAAERPAETGIIDAQGTLLSDLLSYGFSYEAKVSGSLYGPGTAEIEILEFKLYNADFDDVTDEYIIVYEKGKIVLSEKIVTLKGEMRKNYDGTALDYSKLTPMISINIDGVTYANGEIVTVSFDLDKLPPLIDAGKVKEADLHACITVIDQNGVDVSDQFSFDTTKLTFEILTMGLEIKLNDAEKQYDGETLEYNDYSWKGGSLAKEHTLTIQTSGSGSAEIGTYKNKLTGFKVTDLSGKDVTHNYTLTCSEGILKIIE
ncbi:MAG: transglutaminase domain-containing protein [Clostridia bacterium]|nr:transglutaminase domain-containing protein [Clostridia bacterium]